MSKLFITKEDEVRVDLFVSETGSGRIVAWTEERDCPPNVGQCEKFSVIFRQPTYSDTVALLDLATSTTSNGEFAVNLHTVCLHRIAMLVKSWDLVDDNGKQVEPTLESIQNLNPIIAIALSDGLERALKLFDPEDKATVNKATEMLAEANRLSEQQ